MTNGHSKPRDWLYSIDGTVGMYNPSYPEIPDCLINVGCLRINEYSRLIGQVRFGRAFPGRALDARFTDMEDGHVLIDPPVVFTVTEWLNVMSDEFKGICGVDGTRAQWWDFAGVRIRRISRFLAESLIEMFSKQITHGDMMNGITILNKVATEIRLYNCKAPRKRNEKFEHRVDLEDAIRILNSLATIGEQMEGEEEGIPTWFSQFITNMRDLDPPIGGTFWGIEILLLPPPLWTSNEKLCFLKEFHEHHLKLKVNTTGAWILHSKNEQMFMKWKEVLRSDAAFEGVVDQDVHENPYASDFEGMFTFWRNRIYHFNEKKVFINKVDWKIVHENNEAAFLKEIDVMEKIESLFSFADTAYQCVCIIFKQKKKDAMLFEGRKRKEEFKDVESYVSLFSVLKTTKSYGGFSNVK